MCQGKDIKPCLCCHPQSYIRMVQHLIERCMILRMSRDECAEALAKHARVEPLVTLTVWKELMKENQEFFQTYLSATSQKSPTCTPFHRASRFRRRRWYRKQINRAAGS